MSSETRADASSNEKARQRYIDKELAKRKEKIKENKLKLQTNLNQAFKAKGSNPMLVDQTPDFVDALMGVAKDFLGIRQWNAHGKVMNVLRQELMKDGESLEVEGLEYDGPILKQIRIGPVGRGKLRDGSKSPVDMVGQAVSAAQGSANHRTSPPSDLIVGRSGKPVTECTPSNTEGRSDVIRTQNDYDAMARELLQRFGDGYQEKLNGRQDLPEEGDGRKR